MSDVLSAYFFKDIVVRAIGAFLEFYELYRWLISKVERKGIFDNGECPLRV